MSKFSKWKERNDGVWDMVIVPMIVGAIGIPAAMAAIMVVGMVMKVAIIRKIAFIIGCSLGAAIAVYMAGVVLCLFWWATKELWNAATGRDDWHDRT